MGIPGFKMVLPQTPLLLLQSDGLALDEVVERLIKHFMFGCATREDEVTPGGFNSSRRLEEVSVSDELICSIIA